MDFYPIFNAFPFATEPLFVPRYRCQPRFYQPIYRVVRYLVPDEEEMTCDYPKEPMKSCTYQEQTRAGKRGRKCRSPSPQQVNTAEDSQSRAFYTADDSQSRALYTADDLKSRAHQTPVETIQNQGPVENQQNVNSVEPLNEENPVEWTTEKQNQSKPNAETASVHSHDSKDDGSLISKISQMEQDEPLLQPMDEYLANHPGASPKSQHDQDDAEEFDFVPVARAIPIQEPPHFSFEPRHTDSHHTYVIHCPGPVSKQDIQLDIQDHTVTFSHKQGYKTQWQVPLTSGLTARLQGSDLVVEIPKRVTIPIL